MAQMVRNPPAVKETRVRFPGSRRSPGEGYGWLTHSSVLAWRIPWTEEPGGPRGHQESDTAEQLT